MKSKFWTEYEELHLQELRDKYPWKRVASMMGRSRGSVESKAKLLGITSDPNSWKNTERGVKLAVLRGLGMSYSEVATVLGTSPEACRKAFNRYSEFCDDVWRQLLLAEVVDTLISLGVSDEQIEAFIKAMNDSLVPRYDIITVSEEG